MSQTRLQLCHCFVYSIVLSIVHAYHGPQVYCCHWCLFRVRYWSTKDFNI